MQRDKPAGIQSMRISSPPCLDSLSQGEVKTAMCLTSKNRKQAPIVQSYMSVLCRQCVIAKYTSTFQKQQSVTAFESA